MIVLSMNIRVNSYDILLEHSKGSQRPQTRDGLLCEHSKLLENEATGWKAWKARTVHICVCPGWELTKYRNGTPRNDDILRCTLCNHAGLLTPRSERLGTKTPWICLAVRPKIQYICSQNSWKRRKNEKTSNNHNISMVQCTSARE